MAPGGGRTVEPDSQLYPGMAAGRPELQAGAEERAENVSAWPENSSEGDRKNKHEKTAHFSKTGQGALVSDPSPAPASARGFPGTERRTKNDRPLSGATSRS